MSNNTTTAASRLEAWLERAKWTHQELADALGVTRSQVSNLVSGRRSPSLALAVLIEERTGIPASSWVSTEKDGAVA